MMLSTGTNKVILIFIQLLIFLAMVIGKVHGQDLPLYSISNRAVLTYNDTGDHHYIAESNEVNTPVIQSLGTDAVISQTENIIAGEIVNISIIDADRNLSKTQVDTVFVIVTNMRTGEKETVLLFETGNDTGVFSGYIRTHYADGKGIDDDGTLMVQEGDLILTIYNDKFTTTGTSNEVKAETIVLKTKIQLFPNPGVIVANGTDFSILTARVTDEFDRPLPDGTLVQFSADKGTFTNSLNTIDVSISGGNGEAVTRLISPVLAFSDVAMVYASFGGFDSDFVMLEVLPGAVGIRVYDHLRETDVLANDPLLSVELTLNGTTVTGDPISVKVFIDENGVFVVPDIPPGSYQLKADVVEITTGRVISDGTIQTIIVNADGSTSAPKNSISGMVHGRGESSGARYAGSVVELIDSQGNIITTATLDSSGRYEIHGLEPGNYSLRIRLPDGTVATRDLSSRTSISGAVVVNANLLIDPFGRTFDSSSGTPIPDVVVTLRTSEGNTLPIPGLSGEGVVPNVNNNNPFTTDVLGRYAFLFGADQVGTVNQPVNYMMTVEPPTDSPYPARLFYLTIQPAAAKPSTVQQEAPIIKMNVISADGLALALPNSFELTKNIVTIADIETIAFNIPLFMNVPVLSITKSSSQDVVDVGQHVDFSITITNSGNAAAHNVSVVDSLTNRWKLISAIGASHESENIVKWTIPELQPGDSDTLRLTLEPMPYPGETELINYAYTYMDGYIPVTSTKKIAVGSSIPFELTKAADLQEVSPGDEITYTIVLAPKRDITETIRIIDPLPAGFSYVDGSSNPYAVYDNLSHRLEWEVTGVTAAENKNFTFRMIPDPGLDKGENHISNTAEAVYDSIIFYSNTIEVLALVPFFSIDKKANPTVAETGDFVNYNITIKNDSASDSLFSVTLKDRLPHGFSYIKNSSRYEGTPLEPTNISGRDIEWIIPVIEPGKTCILSYRVVIGVNADAGDGINNIYATALTPSKGKITSDLASAKVMIRPELFSRNEVILGRAWIDLNGNGIHDNDEPPVPGVVLMMEDGTRIIADQWGRFSIPEITPGDHILRLLPNNIPPEIEPVTLGTRSSLNPWVRFVTISRSGMAKANFPFREKPLPELPAGIDPFPASLAVFAKVMPDTVYQAEALLTTVPMGNEFFDTALSQLKRKERNYLFTLKKAIDEAKSYRTRIRVEGHADSRPIATERFPDNYALSLARAETVKNLLVSAGVNPSYIDIIGFGHDHPAATNLTIAGRRQNRRAEIFIDIISDYERPLSLIEREITIENDGLAFIDEVEIADSLSIGLRFIEGSSFIEPEIINGNLAWRFTDLRPGETITVKYKILIENMFRESVELPVVSTISYRTKDNEWIFLPSITGNNVFYVPLKSINGKSN